LPLIAASVHRQGCAGRNGSHIFPRNASEPLILTLSPFLARNFTFADSSIFLVVHSQLIVHGTPNTPLTPALAELSRKVATVL
jgi:hypothetical protein